MRNTFLSSLLISFGILCFMTSPAMAKTNKDWGGVAIKGYDPVAYFKDQKPVKGSKDFSFDYDGAKWYFVSTENKEIFAKEPSKYAPQYGGFCAFAVSQGHTADIDPNAFTVLNDKLYLNYSPEVSQRWNQNRDQFIVDADKNWPNLNK